jgi:hypothetical protein
MEQCHHYRQAQEINQHENQPETRKRAPRNSAVFANNISLEPGCTALAKTNV